MPSWILQTTEKLIYKFADLFGVKGKQITKFNPKEWKNTAQVGEFQFHARNEWRQSDEFTNQTIKLFDYFGFKRDEYQNKTVIDLGAGSRLRSKYFERANIIAIEPLADKFIAEISWCDLSDASAVYSVPAEHQIAQCINAADLVVSINVLDHCYDFELIIENISSYLRADGLAFLSFDNHEYPDKMHPLVLNEKTCGEIFARSNLIVENFSTGAGEILKTYGHGLYCLNFWLKKASQSKISS